MSYGSIGKQVRRLEHIECAEFYSRYLYPRVPVILTAGAEEWLQTWTWDFLTSKAGDVQVVVEEPAGEKHVVKLSRFIDYLHDPATFNAPPGLYLAGWDFRGAPELAQQYSRPEFVVDWFTEFPEKVRPHFQWLFLGNEGTGTRLHVDTSGTHAWLTQLLGKKEWILFPPEELQEWQGLDAFDPDFERFPDARNARRYEAELAPGETIFVPFGWIHQVRNLGPSLAVTENFVNESNLVECYRKIVVQPEAVRSVLTSLSLHKASEIEPQDHDPISEQRAEYLSTFLDFRLRELQREMGDVQNGLDRLRTTLHVPS